MDRIETLLDRLAGAAPAAARCYAMAVELAAPNEELLLELEALQLRFVAGVGA